MFHINCVLVLLGIFFLPSWVSAQAHDRTVGVYGSIDLHHQPRASLGCGSIAIPCTGTGGTTYGGTFGAVFVPNRLGASVEVALTSQFSDHQAAAIVRFSRTHRDNLITVLGLAKVLDRSSLRLALGAGPSIVLEHTETTAVNLGTLTFPSGVSNDRRLGISGGADLIVDLSERVGIVVPVRLTYVLRDSAVNSLRGFGNPITRAGIGVLFAF
jgi:hypothetical protein